MNEMELLTRFRDEVPAGVIPARAQSALHMAIQGGGSTVASPGTFPGPATRHLAERGPSAWGAGGRGRRDPLRGRRLALIGGIGLALAAGALIAQAVPFSGSVPSTGITVQELAHRTAAAAAAQPDVRPGQWVYRQEQATWGASHWLFRLWSTADARNAAFFQNGKLTFDCGVPGHSGAGSCGNQNLSSVIVNSSADPGGSGLEELPPYGNIPVKYSYLGSLPRSPRALDRYLGSLDDPHHQPWLGTKAANEFFIIEEMLGSYVMPPRLTAELYLALGDIPGVTVDHHAVDVAGRTGIAFRFGKADLEIIVNPHTYHLMGQQSIFGSASAATLYGTAILREALVPSPGVRP